MASLFFYRKKPETSIFDLAYFNNGKLDLKKIKTVLEEKQAAYDGNKIYNTEGYTRIHLDNLNKLLYSTYIFKNTLGQYTTIRFDEDKNDLLIERSPHFYFGQSRLLITEDLNIMVKANYSSEEGVKGKCVSFFEEIGIDIDTIRFTNETFQFIRNTYNWKRIKLQKIEREKDSTRNISYEVDPSSDKESEVDRIYNECGLYESITFNVDFKDQIYVVKMYKNGHKITVEESQFESKELLEEFCLYLMKQILKIVNNEIEHDIDVVEGGE